MVFTPDIGNCSAVLEAAHCPALVCGDFRRAKTAAADWSLWHYPLSPYGCCLIAIRSGARQATELARESHKSWSGSRWIRAARWSCSMILEKDRRPCHPNPRWCSA